MDLTTESLTSPYGVALTLAGNVYVSDTDNDRVQKFLPGIITVTNPNGGQTWTAGSYKDYNLDIRGRHRDNGEDPAFQGDDTGQDDQGELHP